MFLLGFTVGALTMLLTLVVCGLWMGSKIAPSHGVSGANTKVRTTERAIAILNPGTDGQKKTENAK